jgi:ABC-type branched-subunit amino acid transport system substrate-binding protein
MSKAPAAVPTLLALVMLALAACTTAPPPAPGAGASVGATAPAPTGGGPAPEGPVRLALLVPESAPSEGASRLARSMANAARMAVDDLASPDLELRVYDTGGEPARAAEAARQAAGQGADLILGPLYAGSTRAVGDVAGPEGLKVISFSTDTQIAGGPVYVSGYTPDSEVRRILSYAVSQGLRDVALFHPRTRYGEAAARAAREAQARTGTRIVATAGYERSFRGIEAASGSFAEQARAFGARAVLLPAGGRELQAVGSFMNFHGLDPDDVQYLGLGQWNSGASFQEPALAGGWFPGPDPQALGGFASAYRARHGEEPPVLASLGYDAVQIAGQLLEAARAEGRRDPFSREAITRARGFRGALGPVRFTETGAAEHGMAILKVGQGRFEVRDPAPRAFGAGF